MLYVLLLSAFTAIHRNYSVVHHQRNACNSVFLCDNTIFIPIESSFFSCFSDTNTQITHTQMGCSSCLCYFFLSLYNDWILCTADIFLTSEKEKNQDGYFYRVQSLIRDLYTSPDTRGIRNQYIQCLQLSNYGNVKLYYAVFTSNCVVHTFTACVCLCARYTHSTATQIDIWAAEETSCGRNVFINVKNISKCK